MMNLKEKWNVWCNPPENSEAAAEYLKELTELLKEHGIKFKTGWKEPAPGGERFPISEDYKAHWTVSFRLPETLRADPLFTLQLHRHVPLSEELDFE